MSFCDCLGLLLPWIDSRTESKGSSVDLEAEARPQIDTDTPSWSDHNDSEPGVTVLELGALLVVSLVYFGMVVRLLRAVGLIDRIDWLVTLEDGGGQVDAPSGSGPDERHHVVDGNSGEVRFGDGVRGKRSPSGEGNVRASYRIGGGVAGAVGAAAMMWAGGVLLFWCRVRGRRAS